VSWKKELFGLLKNNIVTSRRPLLGGKKATVNRVSKKKRLEGGEGKRKGVREMNPSGREGGFPFPQKYLFACRLKEKSA